MSIVKKHPFLTLFLAIILTTSLLRSTIVMVGPISEIIINSLGISATNFGLITTIPLLVFAASSAFIPFIASRNGLINTLIGGVILIILGSLLRSVGSYNVLLLGTIFIGLGISINNVLIPAIIKEYAKDKKTMFTSAYLCTQNITASIASGIAFYVAIKFDWQFLMLIWIVPAFLALMFWLKYKKETSSETSSNLTTFAWPLIKELLKSKYAWLLSMVFALQSILYFTIIAWLPTIILENGFSQDFVSLVMISYQLTPLPGLFLAPILTKKYDSHLLLFSCSMIVLGIFLMMFTTTFQLFYVAALSISLGTGTVYACVIAVITNKTKDSQQASSLSAMTQTIGYALAASGPLLSGLLVDLTNDMETVLILILVFGILILLTSIYIFWKRKVLSFT